jgi:hypothetical protein
MQLKIINLRRLTEPPGHLFMKFGEKLKKKYPGENHLNSMHIEFAEKAFPTNNPFILILSIITILVIKPFLLNL